MHRTVFRHRLSVAMLLLTAAGCADRLTVPPAMERSTATELARLTCVVSVQSAEMDCQPAGGVAGGAAFDQAIVGRQGVLVRLTSSGITVSGEIFAFNVTVQNLMSLPMSTGDGASPHPGGVRVFFSEPPTATSGAGAITVENPTGTDIFLEAGQPYFQYGGAIGGVDQPEIGADGILSSGETSATKNWQLRIEPGVSTFTFQVLVASEMPPGARTSIAPQVTSISPATLIPGTTATLTGTNFNVSPGNNTVTIGGRSAFVTAATSTQLEVTVPCVSSGLVPVAVSTGGRTGATFQKALQVAQRTVPVGEMLVLDSSEGVSCNELSAAGGSARYIMAVYSASTTANSNAPFQFSADALGADLLQTPAVASADIQLDAPDFMDILEQTREQEAAEAHHRLLEGNRRVLEQFGSQLQAQRARRRAQDLAADPVEPPLTRRFRVSNINVGNFCNSFYVISANRVYYNGKLAIYEDDATPDAFKAALNPSMASNYQRIGDQFNADMEPILTTHFGDVLRRDAETDNNGVVVAVFSPRINNSFNTVAGFVVSCDQFPNDDSSDPEVGGPYTGTGGNFGASNHGEVFYAYQPVVDGTGYASGNTPDNWYRTIRSTFVHEVKHIVSQSSRVANGSPLFEESWLEEGTARHSEELWGRLAVDNLPWKGNSGHGSLAQPVNTFCDFRPAGVPGCDANPRRPANIMQRHFSSLYTHMFATNARLLSPFGRAPADNSSYFYAVSWSLVRYAIDRYASSEAAFYQALTQSSNVGAENLTAVAGVGIDELLGGWNLALAADDHPLWEATPSADLEYATWNLRNIYAGYNTDAPGTYALTYPLVPTQLTFGSFAAPSITTLRGGGSLWYELSGTQTQPQLIRLEANGGGAPPSTLRLAVTRIQ